VHPLGYAVFFNFTGMGKMNTVSGEPVRNHRLAWSCHQIDFGAQAKLANGRLAAAMRADTVRGLTAMGFNERPVDVVLRDCFSSRLSLNGDLQADRHVMAMLRRFALRSRRGTDARDGPPSHPRPLPTPLA
jgi:hypothetical protein